MFLDSALLSAFTPLHHALAVTRFLHALLMITDEMSCALLEQVGSKLPQVPVDRLPTPVVTSPQEEDAEAEEPSRVPQRQRQALAA